jgi:hypothetical protein
MTIAIATYKVMVDWTGAGDFSGAYDDISSLVNTLRWKLGRDYASTLTGRSVAGTAEIVVKNSDGRFNSFNTVSPIYGNILPGRRVKISMTYNSVETMMWNGQLDSVSVEIEQKNSRATLSCLGPLAIIKEGYVSMPMQTNILTGAAIRQILGQFLVLEDFFVLGSAQLGINTNLAYELDIEELLIDAGQTTMTRWWTGEGIDALNAAREVEQTEAGFLRETKTGKVTFEDRHHRFKGAHLISQASFSDLPAAGKLRYREINQGDPLQDIYNIIKASVVIYTLRTGDVIWTLGESGASSPSLPDGESKTFWAQASAVNEWTTPAATTDYTVNTLANGTGTDLTASCTVSVAKYTNSMRISLTNSSGSDGFITLLQARGTAIVESDPISIKCEDTTSQSKYRKRTFPIETRYIPSTEEAGYHCDWMLRRHKDPQPIIPIRYHANRDVAHMAECIARDVSDRISLDASNNCNYLGVNSDFFVESIAHEVRDKTQHFVSYQLSQADMGYWILGTALLGIETRLIY